MPKNGRPRPYPLWTTALWSLAWLWVMLHVFADRYGVEALSWRAYPVASAQRMVNRDLELATAADTLTGWLGRLAAPLHTTREDALANALQVHWDLVQHLEQESDDLEKLAQAQLQYVLLLTESGNLDDAFDVAREARNGDALAAILNALQGEAGAQSLEVVDELASRGVEDWMLERASIRVHQANQREDVAREIEQNIEARGTRWLRRSDSLDFASIGCIAIGLALLFARLVGRDRPFSLDHASVPAWDLETGLGVLIRGDFWNQMIYILLADATAIFPGSQLLQQLYAQAEPLAVLPLLWLVYRHLLRPEASASSGATPLLRSFGLDRNSWQPKLFLSVTLIAVAIDLAGSSLLSHAASQLGAQGHWAEGFDEMLVWGDSRELTQSLFSYMLWTPLVEELTFRGLLYYSLRRRFGPIQAALLSAAIFSGVHFYSLPGFLTTFWSGLVWALAFERTRSLWPGIIAHSIYNGVYAAGLVLIYR